MTHVRQRLSLLALGVLAPVLVVGAIALSGAPPVSAIGEEPFTMNGVDCEVTMDGWYCADWFGIDCRYYFRLDCGMTTYTYHPYEDANGDDICGLYVYCP